MSNSVKTFSVGYNPINKSNTFTSGDYITGNITLELDEDCKIDSLCVKLKGKAKVKWLESHRNNVVRHKEKFFSIKQFIIQTQKDQDRNIVSQGCQVYPFTFQIPARDLPSSFNGNHGKILYTLEANLSRPMRLDSKAKAQFNFVSKANLNIWPGLMTPQHGMKDKKMNIFGSGTVTMDVSIDKMGFYQGEEIKVVAYVQNRSSQEIKPKYCVYRKHSFFAEGKRKVSTKHILKEVGEAIPPSASQNVTKIITIPPTTDTSVLNCNVIKAEYRLKVYLDVKYASDPEIKFPIVILPPSQTPTVE